MKTTARLVLEMPKGKARRHPWVQRRQGGGVKKGRPPGGTFLKPVPEKKQLGRGTHRWRGQASGGGAEESQRGNRGRQSQPIVDRAGRKNCQQGSTTLTFSGRDRTEERMGRGVTSTLRYDKIVFCAARGSSAQIGENLKKR